MEDKHNAKNWGTLVVAVDPGIFGDRAGFTARVQQLVQRVKTARREEHTDEVLLPGERGFRLSGNGLPVA